MTKSVSLISNNFKKIFPDSLEEYQRANGYKGLEKALSISTSEVIQAVEESGLRGRGGAAYPTGKKWGQAAAVEGPRKVIICNADEGEPGTFKDRYMLEYDPFKIIEGMTIAAYAVGANEGYIYIREEYKRLQHRMKNAIDLAKQNGYLGENILGKDLNFNIKVVSGAGAYVCGEGSSLIESMEGKSGRPRMKPPYIKECGYLNLPTLVNNVETFAVIPIIFSAKFEEYKSYGTSDSIGTKIISISGNVSRPGVYEVPFGVTLREIVFDIAGGIPKGRKVKFLQLGGASGPLVPENLLDVKYSYEDLKKHGLSIGSGAILVADETNSIIDYLKSVQDFFVHESCGKCTPCREGNRQISKIINRMSECNASWDDLETIERFATIMKHASFCGLGKAAPTALFSAVDYFREEIQQYIDKTANVCSLYI